MKKLISLILAMIMVVSLCACGNSTTTPATEAAKAPEAAHEVAPEAPAAEAEAVTKWPVKDVTMVIPYSAGGGTDLIARAYADALEEILDINIVTTNMVGGSGMVAAAYVQGCEADGSVILFGTAELVTVPATGQSDGTVSAYTLTPVSLMNVEPSALLVNAGSEFHTLEDVINYTKENPDTFTLGGYTGGFNGSDIPIHLLEDNAGATFVPVAFNNGISEGLAALVGGHVNGLMCTLAEAEAQLQAGNVRAVAVANDSRLTYWPDVATMKEQGYDTSGGTWRGVFAPPAMDAELVALLDAASQQVTENEAFVEYMTNSVSSIVYKNTADFHAFIDAQWAAFEAAAAAAE